MAEKWICAECGDWADTDSWDEALEMCFRCAEQFMREADDHKES